MKHSHLHKHRYAFTAVFVATILTILKGVIGLLTGSLAILSSALDSVQDLCTSFLNFLLIKKADKRPTHNFSYGFGKLEAFAGLIQGSVLVLMGISLGYYSVRRIMFGAELKQLDLGLGVMFLAMMVSIFLTRYLNQAAQKTNSLALLAEATHYKTDIYSNGGIIVAILLVRITGLSVIDPILSLALSIYIIFEAGLLLKKAILHLLDQSVEKPIREKITRIIRKHKSAELKSFHKLRTRKSGSLILVDFHLVFRNQITLYAAHKIGDAVETDLKKNFPQINVLIHLDPAKQD